MGLFGRRRKDDSGMGSEGVAGGGRQHGGAPDESLGMFSQAEADEFRAAVRTRLAEMGYEAEVHPDRVVTDDGRTWGLWNVAAICHNDEDGRAAWGEAIGRHFGSLFAAEREVSPLDAGLDATMASVHTRLVDAAQLQQLDASSFEYGTEFAPGVLQLLVLDTPTTVLTPAEEQLTKVAPLPTLLDQGWRNTRALLDSEEFVVEQVEHEGRSFTCVMGDSVFTASMALFLPDAVSRWHPGADLSEGVVFSVPHRNQLNFATAAPAESAFAGLVLMPRFAYLGYSEGAGAVSPHTYYWREGVVTQLTEFTDDGISLTPGPDLERILGTLE